MSRIHKTVFAFAKEKNFPFYNSRVLAAVSGGPDSVAMLHVLCALKDKWNLTLGAVHINHMLRDEQSMRDEEFVKKLCKDLGVELFCHRVNIKALKPQGSFEQTARDERHRIYGQICAEHGFHLVALGHNANDRVETFFMRLLRGSGLAGLSSIGAANTVNGINIVRPLLCLSRAEIVSYLEENNLESMRDESNFDTQYTRNRVRHELIPLLKEKFNPEIQKVVSGTIDQIEQCADFENANVEKLLSTHVTFTNNQYAFMKRDVFYTLHPRERSLLFVNACARLRGPGSMVDATGVAAALDAFDQKQRGIVQLPDLNVYTDKTQMLIFLRSAVGTCDGVKIPSPQTCVENSNLGIRLVPCKTLPDKSELTRKPPVIWKAANIGKTITVSAFFDTKNVKFPLTLTGFSDGDKMSPTGFEGTRRVKKVLQDMDVDGVFKQSVLVLKDADGKIIWVPGYRIDRAFALEPQSLCAVRMEISVNVEIRQVLP